MSVRTNVASPPASRTRRTVSFPPASAKSATTTLAPSAANMSAAVRPMPLPPPVMIETLSASRIRWIPVAVEPGWSGTMVRRGHR